MESKLKAVRAGHKSAVTRLLRKTEEEQDLEIEESTELLETLSQKQKIISALDEEILNLTKDDDVEDEILQTDEYKFFLNTKIRHIRKKYSNSPTSNITTLPNQSTENTNQHSSVENTFSSVQQQMYHVPPNVTQNHQLPKLTLPTFTVETLMWQTFWDSFESSVHYNPTLTDIQKFTYLKSQLSNEAVRCIDGLPLTNNNYTEAIKLLKERFGQPHKITNAYMQALLELPAPQYNLISLRNYYDKQEAYIRGLESLGRSGESYGALLIPIILNKLPSAVRQNLARENGTDNWELKGLRHGILKEITILEAGKRTDEVKENLPSTASFLTSANKRDYPRTQDRFENRQKQSTNIRQKPCIYCYDMHDPAKCLKVPDYEHRITIIKHKQLCFNCLGTHRASECKSQFRCRLCNKKHHTSLCTQHTDRSYIDKPSNGNKYETSVHTVVNNESVATATSFHSSTVQSSSSVLLKTAVAPVWSEHQGMNSNILFDEGAQRSFVTEELASKLDIKAVGTEVIHLSAFGNASTKVRHLPKGMIYVESIEGVKIPIEVLVVPTIASPITNYSENDTRNCKHLIGLRLAHPITNDDKFSISLLIGTDFYWDFIEDTVIRGKGPTAVKSKLGYLLSGPTSPEMNRKSGAVGMFNILTNHKPEEFNLEAFWKLESLGVVDVEPEDENIDFMNMYQKTSVEFRKNRYVAKLPWKQDHETLPTNYVITKQRTHNVVKRLSQDPNMLQTYDKIIKDQERRGFIERVEDPDKAIGQVHYIPHHPVKKDSTTTPIRIVYDCSCRQSRQLPSLNDCLLSTPPILNDLTTLLVRFRLNPVAIVTDIEKAFLHVGLHEEDRDVTRFLWLSDPKDPRSHLKTYRFKSVLFGATCSPFILNAVLLKHLQKEGSQTAKILERDLYVDNILSSVTDENEALNYFTEARQLMLKAGFNLRSWTSNNEQLRQQAAKEDVLDTDKQTKILGMRWNVENDELTYAKRTIVPAQGDENSITKREILKESSKIYDPLGLLSPVSIRAKILIQDLWKGGYDWDELLPHTLQSEWTRLSQDIETATETTFSRHYFDESSGKVLHVFVDASMKAYGAVAYLNNEKDTSLVMAKTRVAPLKKLTLPQLELMAAVIGARLAHHLQTTLTCSNITLWSDSQIVLQWIKTTKTLKRFVSNRINEIKKLTDNCEWKYCPTNYNPADLLSRGMTTKQFKESTLWRKGPIWIGDKSKHPKTFIEKNTALSVLTDDDKEPLDDEESKTCENNIQFGIDRIIDINNYGSYKKLLRVSAFVQRFIHNCRTVKSLRNVGAMTPDELQQSTILWIRCCQAIAYQDEVRALKLKQIQKTKLPRLRQLQLYLDNNDLMRCKGRIHNAPIPESAKHPYLLPPNHRLSELIVLNSHELVLHSGVNATVTQVRQTIWIPSLRQFTRKLLHRCTTCKRVIGKPYRAPDPPPLHKIRLQEAPSFTVTGVDFSGALHIKEKNGTLIKAYICLFTCASTRAVHLEVVPDMTEESFLLGFRRFTCKKSLPHVMMSDNATSFISASQEIKQLCESQKIKETLSTHGVEWRFIPSRAPWFGGWWERLIALTKTNLKKILGRALINMETLQTLIAEIEKILNDRPLTYVSTDIDDSEPLTPAHLLYGRRITSVPYPRIEIDNIDEPYVLNTSVASKRAQRLSFIIAQFWNRWKSEYLTALREFHKKSGDNKINIRVGDIVQVHDDKPRNRWKIAIVEELVVGNDGLIRSATIRTNSGRTTRPIVKLYPLEINEEELQNTADETNEVGTRRTLPMRKAAIRAKENIKSWTNS